MKLVLFETAGAAAQYGLLTSQGVAQFDDLLDGDTPQDRLQHLIDAFDTLRPRLAELAATASPVPLDSVRLLPPVPWPGKILITTASYMGDPSQPLLATLKSPESVIGPDDTVRLPDVDSSWQFVPQAMLGLVIRGPARNVSGNNWRTAVFGNTCVVDVMATTSLPTQPASGSARGTTTAPHRIFSSPRPATRSPTSSSSPPPS